MEPTLTVLVGTETVKPLGADTLSVKVEEPQPERFTNALHRTGKSPRLAGERHRVTRLIPGRPSAVAITRNQPTERKKLAASSGRRSRTAEKAGTA